MAHVGLRVARSLGPGGRLLAALAASTLVGLACGDSGGQESAGACPVGEAGCPCTDGGGCDPGLVCQGDLCGMPPADTVGTTGDTTSGGGTMGESTGGTATTTTTTTDGTTTGTGSTTTESTGATTMSLKLDVGPEPTTGPPAMGCTKIDMLFVLDGSGSMIDERAALSAVDAFTSIVGTLSSLGDGGIDYRIAVTTDNDDGYIAPKSCWDTGDPWIDAQGLDAAEVAARFKCAVADFGSNKYEAAVGCEHVLTSATDLLDGDASGFVRADALLVLVLVTDVDDYGAYDQQGGNMCGIGCATPPPPLQGLHDRLVNNVKDGKPDGLAAIVVAGDPSINNGTNFCGQPGSCGCGGFDCAVFHADRLYMFTDLLGMNGVAANICDGPASVPNAVEQALTESIDIACENFEPPQ